MPGQTHILIVEDNDFVRMQIVKFLRDADYDVLEATNVMDAIDLIQKNLKTIACMLVDVRMEPEDGFDFLNKVRAEDIEIPSILVTGDQNTDILSKASDYGVVSVLMKPVNKDRLIHTVSRTISGSGHTS